MRAPTAAYIERARRNPFLWLRFPIVRVSGELLRLDPTRVPTRVSFLPYHRIAYASGGHDVYVYALPPVHRLLRAWNNRWRPLRWLTEQGLWLTDAEGFYYWGRPAWDVWNAPKRAWWRAELAQFGPRPRVIWPRRWAGDWRAATFLLRKGWQWKDGKVRNIVTGAVWALVLALAAGCLDDSRSPTEVVCDTIQTADSLHACHGG